MNVVVLIVESFSKEFVGSFNPHLDNGTYKGYTPFLDSLLTKGLTFEYSYSNGRKSIDACRLYCPPFQALWNRFF